MEPNMQGGLTKRSLEAIESVSEEESKEKRPRLVSEISDDSISEIIFMKEGGGIQDITDEREHRDEPSPTEVIYELSPDNNESLLSVADSKTSSQQPSPSKSEEAGSDENDEMEKKQEMEDEESDENEEDEEEDREKDENSEENSESSESEDDSHEEEDDDSNEDNEDIEEAAKASRKSKKSEEKDGKLSVVSEDESDSDEDDTEELVGTLPDTSEPLVSTLEKERSEGEGHATASDEEESKTSKEKQKTDKANETVDGSRAFEKSADYSKKSVEDLEDLQEDIHKELAQITGKTQKRKHKKTSSSNQREKRHKEKSSSRHKEKEREKEREKDKDREKQWSTEPRGHSRKDYEKERKHYETEEPPWSHDSGRRRPQREERRDWNEKASWTQTRSDRPPSRTETRNKNARREAKETKLLQEEKGSKEAEAGLNGSSSKDGAQKRVISDSMRVMIKESLKERKGFSHEIVDEDSDDSGEHLLVNTKTSDISAASSSDEEPRVERSPEVPKLPPYLPAIRGCRNVEEFQWLNRIEEGTYGVVYRAKDKRSGEVVALKKLKMEKEKEGFPITSLREINTLLKAQHPNIVTVQEIVVGSNMDKIYIVMDFVEHDLKALMETMTQAFLGGEIKTIMIQLLRAVNHLHDNWILHRDIKTSNLLLSNKGILKVGDFGLAREYGSPLKPYTPVVVTLWYRAPELLLGAKEYSTPIDLWSVGCVFAELLTMKPLFNGQSEISQINKIFKELGTPSDKIWPGPPAYSEFPATRKMTFAEYPYNNLRNRFGATLTDNGFDLLNSFLTYDPKRRITAEAALKHDYFKESPSPVDPSMFPSWPARSEGAKRAKKASPKAPEGGNFYKTLSGDGDGAFHIPAGKSQGSSAVPGFTLKF